jgi:integrase/recombinase XerD
LVQRYRTYLISERALAASTIRSYLDVARLFLGSRGDAGGVELGDLCAADVSEFMLAEVAGRSVGSAKYIVCGLRSLLRYLHLEGLSHRPLASAVPTVAGWRLAGLPKAVEPSQVARLLASCDRHGAIGRRDFAILTVLVRLGLRGGEVANLALSDIDWRTGEIVVRGKGRREERLPLPHDVGEAIADWLCHGRPAFECPTVFTRVRAPLGPLTTGGVSSVVLSACGRSGLPPMASHRLRHTAATQMLASGASLEEVGQVLRHRSALTTAIYAKVDLESLRTLARPWPGGAA